MKTCVNYKTHAGFTLLEMIMVVVIMSALAVVALARFNQSSFESQAAAGELIEAIRYAQEKSMTNTGAANYQVQILGNGYDVTQNGVAISHPIDGTLGYTRNWTGITIAPTATIVFDGYGDPGLVGAATFTLTQSSESSTVTVENVTGFTR